MSEAKTADMVLRAVGGMLPKKNSWDLDIGEGIEKMGTDDRPRRALKRERPAPMASNRGLGANDQPLKGLLEMLPEPKTTKLEPILA